MRVCHATSVHPPFDGRIFHKECTTLVRAGHDVTLLAPADWRERFVAGIRVIGLPRIASRRDRPRLWRFIVREVMREKPDIVHFHDPELLLIGPLLRPARLVYDRHEPTAETVLVRGWIPGPLRYPVSRLVALLEPMLARCVDAVVVTEDGGMDRFRKVVKPVIPVYNYPLLSHFDFARCSDGKTVLHVGVLSEARGCTTMIEAMAMVAQRVPGARLLLVGAFDSPRDEAQVCRLIPDLGLQDDVEVAGWVPLTELPGWFARGDAGLIPWQSQSKFPLQIVPTKLFEYMAARLPIVGSDRPAIGQFIRTLHCGLLVDGGDSQALAQAIEHLLTHPAEAREMGERGRQAVEREYRWETEGEKLVELYRRLV